MFVLALCSPSPAFVLNTADTVGQGKLGLSMIYSANTITTFVPDILFGSDISVDLTNHATGLVVQYGLLQNLDVMIGLGNICYSIAPDAPDLLWKLSGGTLFGASLKYNFLKEGKDAPLSAALLLQYITLPINIDQTGVRLDGYDYDVYYKVILSKAIGGFLPYIALGFDSRLLKVEDFSSQSSIGQIDIGYGTAVSEKVFIGAEVNWSGRWHDSVMDDLAGSPETISSAFGWSFGAEYIL